MRRVLSRHFVDAVRVTVTAGKGGDGFISFRREAYVPFGGPDGGHGGRGGDVLITTSELYKDLKHIKSSVKAQDGVNGKKKQQDGRKGDDLLIEVPIGTAVLDAFSGECLHDLDGPLDEPIVLLQGGAGGKGNRAFKTPEMQGPRIRTKGQPGPTKVLDLVLKSIADIGLVGYPNAGKSTLLRAISRSKTEIGHYPFTTMQPHIGHVTVPGGSITFSVADLPGLIEEAHLDKGLGFQFLRHVERTKGLVYVIDVHRGYKSFHVADAGVPPVAVYNILHRELELYQPGLTNRALMVLLNKIDDGDEVTDVQHVKVELENASGLPVFPISAKEKIGLEQPLQLLHDFVKRQKEREAAQRKLQAEHQSSEIEPLATAA